MMISRKVLRISRQATASEPCVFCSHRPTQKRYLAARRAPSTRHKQWQQKAKVITPEYEAEQKEHEERVSRLLERSEDMSILDRIAVFNGNLALAEKLEGRMAWFLHDFQRYRQTDNDFKRMMDHCGVTLDQVYQSTFILRNLGTFHQAKLGRYIVRCCDQAGHPEATIQVVASLLRQDIANPGMLRLREAQLAQDRLQALWKSGNVRATVLAGKLAERRGDPDGAIALYEAASDRIIEGDTGKDHMNHLDEFSSPWMELGILHLRRGNKRKALEAYMLGIDQGDPMAHHMLGRLDLQFTGDYTADWLHNTTKAAATGHFKAAYTLGEYYANTKPVPKVADEEETDEPLTAFGRLKHFFSTAFLKPTIDTSEKDTDAIHFAAAVQDPVQRLRLAKEWLLFARDLTYLPACLHLARLSLRKTVSEENNLLPSSDDSNAGLDENTHLPPSDNAEGGSEKGTNPKPSKPTPNPLYSRANANEYLAEVVTARIILQEARAQATKEAVFRELARPWAAQPHVLEDYEGSLDDLVKEATDMADEVGLDIRNDTGVIYEHEGVRDEAQDEKDEEENEKQEFWKGPATWALKVAAKQNQAKS